MTNADRYPAQVFWSDEDEGFIAIATDLPGCSAFGDTRETALGELLPAIEAWIAAAEAAGNEIPKPSNPAERHRYSGRVLLRMPKDLHARLSKAAEDQDVSLNHHMVYLLASSFVDSSKYQAAEKRTLHEPTWVEVTERYPARSSWEQHLCEPHTTMMFNCLSDLEVSRDDDNQWQDVNLAVLRVSHSG